MTAPARQAPWRIERIVGDAASLHDRPVGAGDAGSIWVLSPTRPALVLGSTQRAESVDATRAAERGIDVVRRRSGGGAVLVSADAVTWVDVVLGRNDPRWTDDVGRSFDWLGDAWAAVLASLAPEGIDADVHRGPLVAGPWSASVCFGGLGPGELTVGGRKVLGISQRRTRAAARFQCALLRRWEPEAIAELLAGSDADRLQAARDLAPVAIGLDELGVGDGRGAGEERIVAALAEVLAS